MPTAKNNHCKNANICGMRKDVNFFFNFEETLYFPCTGPDLFIVHWFCSHPTQGWEKTLPKGVFCTQNKVSQFSGYP